MSRLLIPLTLDQLFDIESDETVEPRRYKLIRFYHYLKFLLPSSETDVMVAASKTLGRLAEFGGTDFGDHVVEFEVPRAIGLLQGEKDMGRYAAVLIMRELARHSPAHFHTYVGLVLDKIWIPMRDSRVCFLQCCYLS